VKVFNETPGPQSMMAWNPGDGIPRACGMLSTLYVEMQGKESIKWEVDVESAN